MLASVLVDVGKLELQELPDPTPGPRDVLLKMSAVGLCGTDFHIFGGEMNFNLDERGIPRPLTEVPQVMGHEITGVVHGAGSEVKDLAVGDRVVLDQGLNCHSLGHEEICEYCERRRFAPMCELHRARHHRSPGWFRRVSRVAGDQRGEDRIRHRPRASRNDGAARVHSALVGLCGGGEHALHGQWAGQGAARSNGDRHGRGSGGTSMGTGSSQRPRVRRDSVARGARSEEARACGKLRRRAARSARDRSDRTGSRSHRRTHVRAAGRSHRGTVRSSRFFPL